MGVLILLLWGVGAAASDLITGPWWFWILVPCGVLVVFSIVGARSGGAGVGLLFVAWGVTGWLEFSSGGPWLVTHAAPVVALTLLSLVTRQIDVRSLRDIAVAVAAIPRSAPLIAPLVLVVLVLPSLSEDVWRVASALSVGGVLAFAGMTAGLLLVLVIRHLRSELPQVLVARATVLAQDPTKTEHTREALRARLRERTVEFALSEADEFLAEAWPTDGAQYAGYIAASSRRQIASPLVGRLLLCVTFVAAVVAIYMYALVSVLVDRALVAEWTRSPVPVRELKILDFVVVLPGGPYVAVTALLACLAVGTFLAFVLIEERFSVALGDALLRLPVDQLLALALPFLYLTEERIANGDPMPADFDVGRPDQNEDG